MMIKFKEIYRFYLRTTITNIWLWLAVLGSTLFIPFFSIGILIGERSGLSFVIAFNHVNMVFPLVVLGYSVWFVNKATHGKVSELFDSYSCYNWQMFFGLFTSLLVAFWVFSIVQFVVIYLLKAWFLTSLSQPGITSIFWFLPFTFFNILLLVSLATFIGVMFKETLVGYVLVFSYQIMNLMYDRFLPRRFRWFAMMHTSVFKYDNYSAFGILGNELGLFLINRLSMLFVSALLFLIAFTLFKRYREKGRRHLWLASAVFLAMFLSCLVLHVRVSNVPVQATAKLAEQARFESIDLYIDQYNITGKHQAERIDLHTSFRINNITKQALPLKFYLARNFSVSSLMCEGESVPFNKQGDLIRTEQVIEPGASVFCTIEYGGSMSEYVKEEDGLWNYRYKLYAYVGPDLVFVPSFAGWYPTTTPIYNYVPEMEWIYPARVQNKGSIFSQIEGEFPFAVNQNILYGYPCLELSVLDGIEYYHSGRHQRSIIELHQIIGKRLAFLQMLVPLPKVQVFEVPQNLIVGDLLIENGNGRIMISENTILEAITHSENTDFHLDRTLFSGWFNLANLGFDYRGLGSQGGFPISILPGNSFGSPDSSVLYIFFQYLFKAENDPSFDDDARRTFLAEQKRLLPPHPGWIEAVGALAEYYETQGLLATKELFQYSFALEQNNKLTWDKLVEYASREDRQ